METRAAGCAIGSLIVLAATLGFIELQESARVSGGCSNGPE
jgi:hypothetical protein